MKKSDVAMIILIAVVSALVAYLVASLIFGRPSEASVKVKTADKITTEVVEPDERVFHNKAINPTVEVVVGEGR